MESRATNAIPSTVETLAIGANVQATDGATRDQAILTGTAGHGSLNIFPTTARMDIIIVGPLAMIYTAPVAALVSACRCGSAEVSCCRQWATLLRCLAQSCIAIFCQNVVIFVTAVALLIGPPTSFETNSEARIVLVLAAISSVNALWIAAIYLGNIIALRKSATSHQEPIAKEWIFDLNKLTSSYFVGPASVLAAPNAYCAWSTMFASHFAYTFSFSTPSSCTTEATPVLPSFTLPALILYGVFTTGYGVLFTYAFISLGRGRTSNQQSTDTNDVSGTSMQIPAVLHPGASTNGIECC